MQLWLLLWYVVKSRWLWLITCQSHPLSLWWDWICQATVRWERVSLLYHSVVKATVLSWDIQRYRIDVKEFLEELAHADEWDASQVLDLISYLLLDACVKFSIEVSIWIQKIAKLTVDKATKHLVNELHKFNNLSKVLSDNVCLALARDRKLVHELFSSYRLCSIFC